MAILGDSPTEALSTARPIMQQKLTSASFIAGVLLLSSCEPPIKVTIEGGNPPVFGVSSGSGKLWNITIRGHTGKESLDAVESWPEVWRVDPDSNASAQYASDIGKITYGVVPRGYHQAVPITGPPPPLVPGKHYFYWIASENGMPARGDFEMREDNAVAVRAPATKVAR